MAFKVLIERKARRQIEKLSEDAKARIIEALKEPRKDSLLGLT